MTVSKQLLTKPALAGFKFLSVQPATFLALPGIILTKKYSARSFAARLGS